MFSSATTVPASVNASPRGGYRFVVAQVLLGLVGLSFLLLRPEVNRPLLLLPILPVPAGEAVRYALAHDARLLSVGPLPGSMIVRGDLDRLAADAVPAGFLVLAAGGGCGTGRVA